MRVLLVDDNPVAQKLFCAMAKPLGWHVDCADSGPAALALLESMQATVKPMYQVIFVDWRMAPWDGWKTLSMLETAYPQGQWPVCIMLSAYGREMLNLRSQEEQNTIAAYLTKPLTRAMLGEAVASATKGSGNVRQNERHKVDKAQRLLGLRILLVEDNPLNQLVARELLQARGATVEIADNGQIGLQAVANAKQPYDVVLMDMQMPVMDGCTAASRIRQLPGREHLPIIAMTANTSQSDRDACLAAGMNDHVGKPFDINYLADLLLKRCGRIAESESLHPPLDARDAVELATEAIDVEGAVQAMGGDHGLYLQIVKDYTAELKGLPDELRRLEEKGDRAAMQRALHTLKGTSATVGAWHMSRQAAAAEAQVKAAAREKNLDEALLALSVAGEVALGQLAKILEVPRAG
jgi:CheY-like chemotaxis protein